MSGRAAPQSRVGDEKAAHSGRLDPRPRRAYPPLSPCLTLPIQTLYSWGRRGGKSTALPLSMSMAP